MCKQYQPEPIIDLKTGMAPNIFEKHPFISDNLSHNNEYAISHLTFLHSRPTIQHRLMPLCNHGRKYPVAVIASR
jgi:hypothetical protein